jgi:hypothetical protein
MKRSTLPARIYSYIARPADGKNIRPVDPDNPRPKAWFAAWPTENYDYAREQLYRAHRYRNSLAVIELKRRKLLDWVMHRLSPNLQRLKEEMDAAEAAVADMVTQIKRANAAARRKRATPQERETLAALRATKKRTYLAWKETRAALWSDPRMVGFQDKVKAWKNKRVRALRAAHMADIYWGTRGLCEKAMEDAHKGPPPNIKRPNRGEGRVGGQITGGMPIGKLFNQDNRYFYLWPPVPPEAFARGAPRRMRRTCAHVRIGSTEKGHPIFFRVPIVYSRPLPPATMVQYVWLTRTAVGLRPHGAGPREEWRLQVVVNAPESVLVPPRTVTTGTVAVDVGWRILPEGLRVAAWLGDDGERGELIIPPERLEQAFLPRTLQSERSIGMAAIKAVFLAWRAANLSILPEWLVEQTAYLHASKSMRKLVGLVDRWAAARFDGDSEIFAKMTAWRDQENRLFSHEECVRARYLKWRKDFYRQFVNNREFGLAHRYFKVVIEDVNWANIRVTPLPELNLSVEQVTYYRDAAAVGGLLQCLKEKMQTELQPGKYTTQRCNQCGELEPFDTATLWHTCSHCGAEWDQDDNARRVLLALSQGTLSQVAELVA